MPSSKIVKMSSLALTFPEVGAIMPARFLRRVVLPAPLGPMTAIISPLLTEKEISFRAQNSFLGTLPVNLYRKDLKNVNFSCDPIWNFFDTFSASRTGRALLIFFRQR